jgi:hypothetical protein
LGERYFATNESMRIATWSLRGQETWPPIVKVVLQASAPNARSAEQSFRSLARPMLDWLKEYR